MSKPTRKEVFLSEMEQIVPWSRLEGLIQPHYFEAGAQGGRPAKPLSAMLRIHFLQQWFALGDLAMEEALHDIPAFRRFAGLDAFEDVIPDESTILHFRHFLERHDFGEAIFAEVNAQLASKGLTMKRGTVVDASLISAPSSTKNQDRQRDPEMSQTKKGHQYYFGMKVHIGVDADSGLVHTVKCTTAKVADIKMMSACLHGEEVLVLADRGYHKRSRTLEAHERENGKLVLTPSKKPRACQLTPCQKEVNRALSALRAKVEHPFRLIKRQFGYTKVRYRGIAKNAAQIITLFALSNLWQARHRLLAYTGQVRP
ncbi:MAG: IS5 family transposase [Azoarcus sp.]|nr:IS5 family transposase [Azoarcus sp.]